MHKTDLEIILAACAESVMMIHDTFAETEIEWLDLPSQTRKTIYDELIGDAPTFSGLTLFDEYDDETEFSCSIIVPLKDSAVDPDRIYLYAGRRPIGDREIEKLIAAGNTYEGSGINTISLNAEQKIQLLGLFLPNKTA